MYKDPQWKYSLFRLKLTMRIAKGGSTFCESGFDFEYLKHTGDDCPFCFVNGSGAVCHNTEQKQVWTLFQLNTAHFFLVINDLIHEGLV